MPDSFRLPTNVRPIKYRLSLRPDLDAATFQGEETVDVEILEPTIDVVLNASDLQIFSAQIALSDESTLSATSIDIDESRERATLTFDKPLPQGRASLALKFTGILNDQLRGFYRSQYTDAEGRHRFLATTQFEATDARRAFPCWDEPSLKATFEVTLIIPSDLTAISNAHVISEIPNNDSTKSVSFAETPKMSTYLLAFIVGDMASVERETSGGTLVRVWATRGKEQHGAFALQSAVNLLSYFNDYFGIPYPLKKLDHIAIPDFAAGAMENWGAITYREVALLFDPDNSAAQTRQRIVEIIAHEMAHMWFGDLATMEWWDDLWLNESFASWMGNKASDHLHPEWDMWTQFVSDDTNAGLNLDGLRNSHPIEARVNDPAEIREIFDAISYSKGASILRMLEQFLGEDVFRRGLQSYLSTHQYSNARTEDLWKALEDASGQPVTSLMDTWVKQTGYPLLHVTTRREGSKVDVGLSQSRFLYEHLSSSEKDETAWQVPVRILRKGASDVEALLLKDRRSSVTLVGGGVSAEPGWVKVNAGRTGFYRVNYPLEEWERFRPAIEDFQLPADDRLGLLSDAYAMVRAGYAQASLFLSLVEAYKNEEDAIVLGELAAGLRSFETPIADKPYLTRFYACAREIFQPIAKRVGWDAKPEEGHLDALRRSAVLGRSGVYGDPDVLKEAQSRFQRYLQASSSLHPDIRGVVYSLVAQEGDQGVYQSLWDLERQAALHEEKMRLLGALTRPKQRKLLEQTLERSMSSEVKAQDSVLVITGVAANHEGRDMAWEFIKDNWKELDRRYGRGGFMITRLVTTTQAFTTPERAEEVERFFRDHPAPSAQRTVQQSLERIRLNVEWLKRNDRELEEWFAARESKEH